MNTNKLNVVINIISNLNIKLDSKEAFLIANKLKRIKL